MTTAPETAFTRPRFDLSGGAPCLDLANTWGDRARPERDRLREYRALLSLVVQQERLTAGEAARLLDAAATSPREAQSVLQEARELRDACYAVFSAAAAGRPPPANALTALNEALAASLPHLRLAWAGGAGHWQWAHAGEDLHAPLWGLARSAAELLTSPDLDRVRECDGDACTWLFLDRSRNRSRRWCDMASCGNRAKARRHYRRTRGRRKDAS